MFRDDFVWGVASSAYQKEEKKGMAAARRSGILLRKKEESWMAGILRWPVITCTDIKMTLP